MEKLLRDLKYDFFTCKVDEVFINPKSYKIPRRDFHKVRAAVEKMGLRVAWLSRSIVDTHDWYFYREDDNGLGGWLHYARTDV